MSGSLPGKQRRTTQKLCVPALTVGWETAADNQTGKQRIINGGKSRVL